MQDQIRTKYSETPQTIAAKLRSHIAGSKVEVAGDDENLYISAVFPAPSLTKARLQVRSVLFGGLDLDDFPELHFQWAPDRQSWEVDRIRDAVVAALPLRGPYKDLNHVVTVRADGFVLKIRVDTAGIFCGLGRSAQAREREAWYRRIAALNLTLPEGITQLTIQIGDTPFDACALWVTPSFDAGHSADGETGNPNWPSKTGNPSGGGRGNNPPRGK